MLTKRQKIAIAVWVGGPIVLFVVLMLINPSYETFQFKKLGFFHGIDIIISLEFLTAMLLWFVFRRLNRMTAVEKARRRKALLVICSVLTFFLCTIPTIWMVIFWPSVMILLHTSLPPP